MSAPIQSAPLAISDYTEDEMALTIPDLCSLLGKNGVPTKGAPPCQRFVKIGLFFDGTNNNRDRDMPVQGHTNVVKLFNAHKDVDGEGPLEAPAHYRIYIPGLGTRFPENREWRESQEGKAFGKGGQARILYALLEVYNAAFRTFNDGDRMFSDEDITVKLQQYTRDVESNDPLRDAHEPRPDRRSWFGALSAELDARLRKARKDRPLPAIPRISLCVFGFSRGAVQARAFCYWFADLLAEDGTFAGMPADIDFLGLFDSVASIGLAHSVAETAPLPFADGHWTWAGEIRQPLPACVKQTVHYIAAHEQRRNFPLTRVSGGNVTEVLYPGVHADVGGGYSPGDQGRAMWNGQGQTALLLAQVPLSHMHQAARKAGVPLLAYCVMPSDMQDDYTISPTLSSAWNNYMAAGTFEGDYHGMVREHMRLYYAFRRQWLREMRFSPGFCRSNPQDREDLDSYNNLLIGDLALLRRRVELAQQGGRDVYGHRGIILGQKENDSANAWQALSAFNGTPPSTDELWALQEFDKSLVAIDTPYLALLENHIHDSLAGFYLAGYVSDEEKAEALLTMAREHAASGRAPATPYRKQLWQNYQNAIKEDPALGAMMQNKVAAYQQAENAPGHRAEQINAMENARQGTIFTTEEQARLATLFPTQTDAHAAELRSAAVIRTQTESRREGSGYLRRRHVFS